MLVPTIYELGIPHTQTTKRAPYNLCAFTQKTCKRIPMLRKLGYPVVLLSAEGSDIDCEELVEVVSEGDLQKAFAGKDFMKEEFDISHHEDLHSKFYENSVKALQKRLKKGDVVYCSWGSGHQLIIDELSKHVNVDDYYIVEPGIGYPISFAPYRVYESYARLNIDVGLFERTRNVMDIHPEIDQHFEARHYTQPQFQDAVIPVYFDPDEFEVADTKSDYYLFVGRLTRSKGLEEAVNLAHVMGKRLLVCGQGDFREALGYDPPPHVEILGSVDIATRKILMRDAELVICYTYFPEPGCNVHVEALASDTPVITSNRGIFPETVHQGVVGFRCQSFRQMVVAAKHLHLIPRGVCREYALNNFSCDRVSLQFHYYHEHIRHLKTQNYWHYDDTDTIADLEWLVRPYPAESISQYMQKVIKSHTTQRLIVDQVKGEFAEDIQKMIATADDPQAAVAAIQNLLP